MMNLKKLVSPASKMAFCIGTVAMSANPTIFKD